MKKRRGKRPESTPGTANEEETKEEEAAERAEVGVKERDVGIERKKTEEIGRERRKAKSVGWRHELTRKRSGVKGSLAVEKMAGKENDYHYYYQT